MEENKIIDVVLTKEQREVLENSSTAHGIQIDRDFPYVPEVWRTKDKEGNYLFDESMRPVFYLRGAGGVTAGSMKDKVTAINTDGTTSVRTNGVYKDACLRGILSWKNYTDNLGLPIAPPEKKAKITEEHLERFALQLINELGLVIIKNEKLSEEEKLGLGL